MAKVGNPSRGILALQVSQTDLAELLGCSRRHVQDLTSQELLPRDRRTGKYPAAKAVQAYLAYQAGKSGGRDEAVSYEAERARLVRAQADRAELRRDRESGRLLDSHETRLAVEHLLAQIRQRLLDQDANLSPVLALKTEAEVESILGKERAALLRLLATSPLEFEFDLADPELDTLDPDSDAGEPPAPPRSRSGAGGARPAAR